MLAHGHSSQASSLLRALQVGPRLNFSTAWSANAVSIFRSCGLTKVVRAECSRRFRLRTASGNFALSNSQVTAFASEVCAARPCAALLRRLTPFPRRCTTA